MRTTATSPDQTSVFLNVPYDPGYEKLFVTLVGAIVCLGLTPRCALEVSDNGHGRLKKICDLINTCRASIHDLSRVSVPVRFNMPFELGLAYSRFLGPRSDHDVVLLERRPHRLSKTLSDLKWIDPLIHEGRCDLLVTRVIDAFVVPGDGISPDAVRRVARQLRRAASDIVSRYKLSDIYSRSAYLALVASAVELAADEGLID